MFARKMVLVCAVLSIISSLSYSSSVTPAEAAQWREDLHFFAEQASHVHKNLYHSITRVAHPVDRFVLDERLNDGGNWSRSGDGTDSALQARCPPS
jgi:hypothetical protein